MRIRFYTTTINSYFVYRSYNLFTFIKEIILRYS
nr:MAG TPA: hypothetical protein [Caudoviricetes sp.]